jgi:hypothetical protein
MKCGELFLFIFIFISNPCAYIRYCLGVAILAFLYSMGQTALKLYETQKNGGVVPRKTAALVDFAGDQVSSIFLLFQVCASSS